VGDGESQEGQIWEAAMFAAAKKLDNLIAFTDYNKLQIDGPVSVINDVAPLADKWRAFGWEVFDIDGHDHEAILKALQDAKKVEGKPSMIILNTVKGSGVSFLEGQLSSHCMTVTEETVEKAVSELREEVQ
jgi:transketolase